MINPDEVTMADPPRTFGLTELERWNRIIDLEALQAWLHEYNVGSHVQAINNPELHVYNVVRLSEPIRLDESGLDFVTELVNLPTYAVPPPIPDKAWVPA